MYLPQIHILQRLHVILATLSSFPITVPWSGFFSDRNYETGEFRFLEFCMTDIHPLKRKKCEKSTGNNILFLALSRTWIIFYLNVEKSLN